MKLQPQSTGRITVQTPRLTAASVGDAFMGFLPSCLCIILTLRGNTEYI